VLQHTREAAVQPEASLTVEECETVQMTGCQVINARVRGILVRKSLVVRIADCTIRGRTGDKSYRAAVAVDEASRKVMVVNNFIGHGSDGAIQLPKGAGSASGNMRV
jgi:hypothetical protein